MPASAELSSRSSGSKLRSLTMALFVFFSAAARAGIVAADLTVVDRLFVAVAGSVAPHKLQLSQLLFFLALDIASEVLNRRLRRRTLLLARSTGTGVFLFLVFLFLGERQ